ncbi:MAG: undecaprenyl-phosphate glucose phosphotransferase [Acidobacteria bacterium]|nr:MAG: undecaprenyl-phosphate glucose phosphotransferase [Acidobacteriota bacterium]
MRRFVNFYHFYLRIVIYSLPFLSFSVAGYARILTGHADVISGINPYLYFDLVLLTTFLWAIIAEHFGIAAVQTLFQERTGIRAAFPACVLTYSLDIGLLFFFHRYMNLSRMFFAFSGVSLFLMTLTVRAVFRLLAHSHSGLRKPNRILVVGSDRFARRATRRLIRGPLSFCRVIGYVSLPEQAVAVDDAPVYPLQQVTERISRNEDIDEVILALPPTRFSDIPYFMKMLERFCLPVRAIVDLGDHTLVRERLFQFGRLQIFDLTATPTDSIAYSLLKRAFDIVFSTFAILLTAPLMAAIALAVRLTSPGPALFVQDRVGLNGKVFRMYKFRTMRVADSRESDRRHTTPNDPRRTRLGILLRKMSLDELPQFFNVLKGDMSIVGPRPELVRFVEKFLQEVARYNNRHRLKVGITGWAQVNGWRGDTSIRKRVEHDLFYLQNWSFTFDLRIIFLTLFPKYRNKNAY